MSEQPRLLSLEGPERRVTPQWGIPAILALIVLLGVVLHQRFSEGDRSWARWEKHELTGVVLGQSPDQEFVPASKTPPPARKSTVPPLWSQTQNSRPESQRTPRELSQSVKAPAQSESAGLEGNDPFGTDAAPARRSTAQDARMKTAEFEGTAPRVLFQGEDSRMTEAPIRHQPAPYSRPASAANSEFSQDAAYSMELPRSRSAQGSGVTPAALEFSTSSLPGSATSEQENREIRSAQEYRVQQAAGTDQPTEQAFPEAVPFNQLPISEMPAQHEHVSGQQRGPSSLPPMGLEHAPMNPPKHAPEHQHFAEPALSEPQPTLTLPSQQPHALPSLDHAAQMPVQSLERESPHFAPAQPAYSPAPAIGHQQTIQPQHNEPVPATAVPRQAMNTPAPQATVAEDEVYQVQSGDNYWTISRKYYGSARFFSSLAEYNKHRIPAPEKMKPGMYVLVPNVEILHQRYPQLTGGGPRDPAETAPPGFFVDANGQPCYRVGKGDTLTDIAQAYLGRSSRWVQIQGMNKDRLTDGKALKIGIVLRLPSDASQVVLAPVDAEIR